MGQLSAYFSLLLTQLLGPMLQDLAYINWLVSLHPGVYRKRTPRRKQNATEYDGLWEGLQPDRFYVKVGVLGPGSWVAWDAHHVSVWSSDEWHGRARPCRWPPSRAALLGPARLHRHHLRDSKHPGRPLSFVKLGQLSELGCRNPHTISSSP